MILILDRNKQNAEAVSEMLYYMGVLSYAADLAEGLSELSPQYRAVLIINPSAVPDAASYVGKIKSYDARVPIFSLTRNGEKNPAPELFEINFDESSSYADIVKRIAERLLSLNQRSVGSYMLSGIDASANRRSVSYFDTTLPLTRTETMILRFLIRSYPTPKAAKDILKYSFKSRRAPEAGGIRTHISCINRKFKVIKNRNLISSFPDEGYVIMTPELLLTKVGNE